MRVYSTPLIRSGFIVLQFLPDLNHDYKEEFKKQVIVTLIWFLIRALVFIGHVRTRLCRLNDLQFPEAELGLTTILIFTFQFFVSQRILNVTDSKFLLRCL